MKTAKRKKSRARRIVCISILSFLVVIALYYFKIVCPLISRLGEERVRSISLSVISEVVGETMSSQTFEYGDLVKVSYSSEKSIEAIEIDTIKVNELIRQVTKQVQNKIDNLKNEQIGINLGTFTGIPFLYGFGPKINVKIIPIGTVNSDIFSSLTSCGINQSLHRLYFTISVRLGLILPSKTQSFTTSQDVLVCESVILGRIPSFYLGNNLI